MSHPLYVAFIWHQHQPLYKSCSGISSLSVQYRLPWVRLHGTKDYLDLVLLLERYPKLHQTVNLVPSLILQLEDYIAGTAFDPYLEVTLTPCQQLTQSQREFIIQHFFDANHHTLIDPHPRYRELYYQRQEKGQAWCLANWQENDYGDLLAWHNLAWIDPLFWDDPQINAWLKQQRNFTLSDRQRIYSKQREILSRILPQHRKMQQSGQFRSDNLTLHPPHFALTGRYELRQSSCTKYDFTRTEISVARRYFPTFTQSMESLYR